MKPLFDTAPGFDQPLAVLEHCHARIRKQLGTLRRLLDHLPEAGPDIDAKQASTSIMRYFNLGAVNHHEDEEHDLLPMLQASASGNDARLLQELVAGLLREHRQMNAGWQTLNQQLKEIAAGSSSYLAREDVDRFSEMYAAHMETEEMHVIPMAMRILSASQIAELGEAMRLRRGITG